MGQRSRGIRALVRVVSTNLSRRWVFWSLRWWGPSSSMQRPIRVLMGWIKAKSRCLPLMDTVL